MNPGQRLAAGLGLAAAAGAGLYRFALNQPRSPLDGVVSPPGVKTDVEIIRDRAGVPHIYAANSHDLYYALGFVHAQDRLWHLELNRRLGRGQLSEIFGEASLGFDRFMRRIGLGRAAELEAAILAPAEAAVLEAYAAGINGFLTVHRHRLPLEFRLLRFRPRPWDPVDSLAWAKVMGWMLSENWSTEWFRARLIEEVGPEVAAALDPAYPTGHPISIEPGFPYSGVAEGFLATFQAVQEQLALFSGGMSNAWVVAPERSATGAPLLASDPHLRPQMPSIWYEAHLAGAGLDVVGATMPGLPAVLIGHNQRIAWGITASMVDTQDLFIERLKPDDPTQYQTPNGWEPIAIRREEIVVRGRKEPVVEEVQETRHGPALSPLLGTETRLVTVQCPILGQGQLLRGGIRLNRAQNWDEFRAALADWDLVVNFVYADHDGNIGYQLSGMVPLRGKGTGLLPSPGWDADYDWQGFIPADQMPSCFNPAAGYIVTANNRIVGDQYPHTLSWDWGDGFRAMRIEDQLRSRERHTVEDFAAMQMDFYSAAAQQIVEALADVEPRAGDPLTTRALEHLRRWNCQLTADSVAAAIYVVLRQRLLRNVFGPRLGRLMGPYLGNGSALGVMGSAYPARISGFLIETLRRGDPQWLVADGTYKSWDELKWGSLSQAVLELCSRLGDDVDSWRWGRLHQVSFDHPIGQVKPLDRVFCRGPYPLGGDGDTPHQASFAGDNFAVNGWIPSYRQIVDLGQLANSQSIHTTGQSGLPGSPHFDDFIPLWRAGRYHATLYERSDVLQDLDHLVVLRPR